MSIPGPNARENDLVADDVCSVLSLASGTNIQWVARTDFSQSGAVVRHYHASRITKSFGSLAIIDPRTPDDLPRFVTVALPVYVARKAEWDLTRCLYAFLDARAESDFLEARGLKLAVVMEMLTSAIQAAEHVASTVRPDSEFANLRRSLKKVVGTVLRQHGGRPRNAKQCTRTFNH